MSCKGRSVDVMEGEEGRGEAYRGCVQGRDERDWGRGERK